MSWRRRCGAAGLADKWLSNFTFDRSVARVRSPRPVNVGVRQQEEGAMATPDRSRVMRLRKAQVGVVDPDANLQHGSLDVKLTAPAHPNVQTPHVQDEIYMVIRGRGVLFHDGTRDPFESGDLLFVAATIEHRFEDHSDDLLVWRVFYGPTGGEVPA